MKTMMKKCFSITRLWVVCFWFLLCTVNPVNAASDDDILDFLPPILAVIKGTPNLAFAAERVWTSDNIETPIVFLVSQEKCFTVEHSGQLPLAIINIDLRTSLGLLEDKSKQELCFKEGRHVLTPVAGRIVFNLPNLPTRTTLVSLDPISSPPLESTMLIGDEELCASLDLGGGIPIIPIPCKPLKPTLDGKWRRPDGRTVSCDLELGTCIYTAYGDFLSSVERLPNLIGQPMLRGIKPVFARETLEGFLCFHRSVRTRDSDRRFISTSFEEKTIIFRLPDEFETVSGVYTRVK